MSGSTLVGKVRRPLWGDEEALASNGWRCRSTADFQTSSRIARSVTSRISLKLQKNAPSESGASRKVMIVNSGP